MAKALRAPGKRGIFSLAILAILSLILSPLCQTAVAKRFDLVPVIYFDLAGQLIDASDQSTKAAGDMNIWPRRDSTLYEPRFGSTVPETDDDWKLYPFLLQAFAEISGVANGVGGKRRNGDQLSGSAQDLFHNFAGQCGRVDCMGCEAANFQALGDYGGN